MAKMAEAVEEVWSYLEQDEKLEFWMQVLQTMLVVEMVMEVVVLTCRLPANW
jgi:uncharacterized protein YndB with AHSA1/START domain